MESIRFELTAQDGRARAGRLSLARGTVQTPAFMPVGTAGSVKGVTRDELRTCGAEIVLANTYHLYIRPGHEVVRDLGGLHRFMQWDGPILTDSGGYQVFSMSDLCTIDDDGVDFRSHLDGSAHRLTPESSMEIQTALGSDIVMAFDECPALPAPRERVEVAVRRTTAWARRSMDSYRGDGALFGIVQGGPYHDLREASVRELLELDLPGYAIGGISVGEPELSIPDVVRSTAAMLPRDRPRYLMGVGRPQDLVEAVHSGVDMFDCVMPTRHARNGSLFTSTGRIHIKRAEYVRDPRPIEEGCPCMTCKEYSRGYLRHLFQSGEVLSSRLNTIHNLTHYLRLMRAMREAIAEGRFDGFREAYRARRAAASEAH